MFKKCLMLAVFGVMLSPAAARADWLLTPHLGTTFGGNTSFTYGASIGWMGSGIVGWETEFAFTPDILSIDDDLIDDDPLDLDLFDSSAMTIMFNALVGVPIGGTSGTGFRPYVSGGLGWFATSFESDEFLFDDSSNKFGFNLGGGALGYWGNVGIRGDVRYYQTLADEDFDEDLGLEFGDFDYWRGTVGVVFRW